MKNPLASLMSLVPQNQSYANVTEDDDTVIWLRSEASPAPRSPVSISRPTTRECQRTPVAARPGAGICVCGRAKAGGKLCNVCFRKAPDYIIEDFLTGSSAHREAAERWLVSLAGTPGPALF